MRKIMMLGLAMLVLSACSSLQQHNRNQARDSTLEGYGAALRWGDWQGAWAYVDPAYRKAHPLTAQQKALYATVKVGEYEPAAPVESSPGVVEQTAQISLIVKSNQQVYSVFDHQTWHWDETAKRWWLETGLPDLADRN